MLAGQLADTVCHPGRFFTFIPRAEKLDRLALAGIRPQGFFLAACIVGNHLIGGVQDVRRRTVILLQLDNRRIGIILFKIQNVSNIRAAPAINRLVIIAHNAQVMTFRRQKSHQLILRIVRVLILVHHNVTETLPIAFQYRRMVCQKGQRFQQQIVKIQCILCPQAGFILQEYVMNHLAAIVPCALLEPLIRSHQLILRIGNAGTDFLVRQRLFIHIQALKDFFDGNSLVIVIINYKRTGIAQFFNITPKDPRAGSVEGGNPCVFRLLTHQFFNALPHFLCSLVSKGQGQNRPGCYPMIHQVCHAIRQGAGFAAACTCKNEHRSFQCFCCKPLLCVQHRKIHFSSYLFYIIKGNLYTGKQTVLMHRLFDLDISLLTPATRFPFPMRPGHGDSHQRHRSMRG